MAPTLTSHLPANINYNRRLGSGGKVYDKRNISIIVYVSLFGGQLGVGGSMFHSGIKLPRVEFSQSGEIER